MMYICNKKQSFSSYNFSYFLCTAVYASLDSRHNAWRYIVWCKGRKKKLGKTCASLLNWEIKIVF